MSSSRIALRFPGGKLPAAVAVVAILLLVYGLDRYTHQEFSLFPLYLIPICVGAIQLGAAAGYLLCFLSSLVWLIAAGQTITYTQPLAPLIGMLSRAFVFFLITYLLLLYRSISRRSLEQLQRLQLLLPICPDCGCILCVDGQWRSLDAVINNSTPNAFPSSCICHH